MAPRRRLGIVERAARADLRAVDATYSNSGVAKAYLDAARRLDADPTDRDGVALMREMRLCLLTLWELSPAKREDDSVDEFTKRREERMRTAQ